MYDEINFHLIKMLVMANEAALKQKIKVCDEEYARLTADKMLGRAIRELILNEEVC